MFSTGEWQNTGVRFLFNLQCMYIVMILFCYHYVTWGDLFGRLAHWKVLHCNLPVVGSFTVFQIL